MEGFGELQLTRELSASDDVEICCIEDIRSGWTSAKRAKIQGMDSAGAGKQRIKATVPQAEVARYAIDLRSLTGGRAAFTMRFSHYEEVPAHLQQKIIAEAIKEGRVKPEEE